MVNTATHDNRLAAVEQRFHDLLPGTEFCSLRVVFSRSESLSVRRDVPQPPALSSDTGAMVTVLDGGLGYAATPDLSDAGLRAAFAQARDWARSGPRPPQPPSATTPAQSRYATPQRRPWAATPTADKLDLLAAACRRLRSDERIIDWSASLWQHRAQQLYLNSDGARCEQSISLLLPNLSATAQAAGESQTRTLGGGAYLRQGGLEILEQIHFDDAPEQISEQALALLAAPNCPDQICDLLLMPDQMMLQIHESIGHPLELDRILGDERNYAGGSFVSPDMFGNYRYGSALLNVTFDPGVGGEAASYSVDDDGSRAERAYLIKDGVLLRPLGGMLSQRRAGVDHPGIANSRASSWNRAPIDRMANLNVEPGAQTLTDMINATERGVLMHSNRSWSIDDSRNKFQFGCEYAQLISDGELGAVVKNPNYRGVSADFWRSLVGVGGADEMQALGTPFCGKGEPNQAITVGHASPPCRFSDVAVFGGG